MSGLMCGLTALALVWCRGIAIRAADPETKREFFVQRDDVRQLPKGIIPTTLRISPDAKRLAGVIQRGDNWVISIDGVDSPEYEAIVQDSIHFSPDSKRVGYGAKRDGKAIVVVDGDEYPAFDASGIGFPIFSSNSKHFLYVAARPGSRMCVVTDGKEGEAYEAIMKGGPVFGPDGTRLMYVAKDGASARVVIDGVAGPKYLNIDTPTFSPDGKHFAYVAVTPTTSILVADGREAVMGEHFMRESLGFDSPTRLHILSIDESGTVTRLEVDLLESFKAGKS